MSLLPTKDGIVTGFWKGILPTLAEQIIFIKLNLSQNAEEDGRSPRASYEGGTARTALGSRNAAEGSPSVSMAPMCVERTLRSPSLQQGTRKAPVFPGCLEEAQWSLYFNPTTETEFGSRGLRLSPPLSDIKETRKNTKLCHSPHSLGSVVEDVAFPHKKDYLC